MSEEPIKLFAKRSERLPQPDDAEKAGETALEVLKKLPIVGDSAAYIISLFFNPFQERRDEWFKELADGLEELEAKVAGFNVEDLPRNEAFVSATIQATRIATGTHQKEKREYLRNALLNIATGKTPDEIKQQIFLNAIESFSTAHVKALNVIWRGPALKIGWDENSIPIPRRNYGAAIGIVAPEIKGESSLIGAILADLRNRGFSNLNGPDLSFPQGGIVTNLGVEFLNFVLSPDDLPKR
jgi:hypothetical protein